VSFAFSFFSLGRSFFDSKFEIDRTPGGRTDIKKNEGVRRTDIKKCMGIRRTDIKKFPLT
jgi:hypothetical protein